MATAKRARKAETPKQPSPCLRLRAPYLYPDPTATLDKARPLRCNISLGARVNRASGLRRLKSAASVLHAIGIETGPARMSAIPHRLRNLL
jgi:hypothetical protein